MATTENYPNFVAPGVSRVYGSSKDLKNIRTTFLQVHLIYRLRLGKEKEQE